MFNPYLVEQNIGAYENQLKFNIEVFTRYCVTGELRKSAVQCEPCLAGTYSLDTED